MFIFISNSRVCMPFATLQYIYTHTSVYGAFDSQPNNSQSTQFQIYADIGYTFTHTLTRTQIHTHTRTKTAKSVEYSSVFQHKPPSRHIHKYFPIVRFSAVMRHGPESPLLFSFHLFLCASAPLYSLSLCVCLYVLYICVCNVHVTHQNITLSSSFGLSISPHFHSPDAHANDAMWVYVRACVWMTVSFMCLHACMHWVDAALSIL